ncbi:MAG: 6-carboxytetrahydropterin synthase [Austwickia sp.]|nr:6-carboxytetrahydropterin synthase [Actinomycetota bacterium]MCB1254193.1 6-carboxytetrahydropterin synthase [Austwickia sp.]MCO5311300.1 6-carboxytetrahydropterin synthase [Austwickia sp.]
MYALTVRDHVMIAHSLADPFFGPAQALHGATLVAEVTWRRERLDEHGVVLDIGAATTLLRQVLADLDYRNLDDHPAFAGRLSTTEAIAAHVADAVADGMPAAGLPIADFVDLEVLLREHPDAWASYRRPLGTTS